MKILIYTLTILCLYSCSLNHMTTKQKHRNYVRNFYSRQENFPFRPRLLESREYHSDNLQKDLVKFLDGMSDAELVSFKKDFIYTKSEVINKDSLMKK